MQYINRDQTRIELYQFECFGLKILITRGLATIICDFKSENSILTNLSPVDWSILWIQVITSHYTLFHGSFKCSAILKIFGQRYELSYVWKEMQQWLKSIQQEDIKLKPICSPIFLIYHSTIQECDSSHHKQTMLCARFSNNLLSDGNRLASNWKPSYKTEYHKS